MSCILCNFVRYPAILLSFLVTIFIATGGYNPPKFPEFGVEYRSVRSLGFIKEDIQEGRCRRAILIAGTL